MQDDNHHIQSNKICNMTFAFDSNSTTRLRTSKANHLYLSGSLPAINSVPPEVFIEILSYLKPNSDYHLRANQNDLCARAEVTVATHVCQLWRQIALSTPFLWNCINVDLTQKDSMKTVECVTSWLTRGREWPLYINLSCWQCEAAYQRAWEALLLPALQHSLRWREATFTAPYLDTDLSAVRNNLPLLQTLRVLLCEVEPPNNFETAPMLRSVTAMFEDFGHHLRSLGQLPWTQLTDVAVHHCSTQDALSMLQMIPSVVKFTAHSAGPPGLRVPIMRPPIRLFQLQNLALSGGIDIDRFLDSLELPSLTSFSFSECSGVPTSWSTSFISLVHRSSCHNIDTLNLTPKGDSGSEEPSLDKLIRVTPKLKTLDLLHGPFGDLDSWGCSKLLQALTASPVCGTSPYPAPELETLRLEYAEDFQVSAFVDMVESRWRVEPGGPVKRLHVILLRYVPDATRFDPVTIERLQEFAAEGLYIRVHFEGGEAIVFEQGPS